MLSLKDKLLKAGLVTAEQVKKVEDDEAQRKQRAAELKARRNKKSDDKDEARAARDHKEEEAQRWRKRLLELQAAGKAEQYEAIRGWVDRHRLDDKKAVPSEQAVRFHFAKGDGSIGHITIEPALQAQVSAGEAGIVAFMGFNGLEHAVVPADLARDIHVVRPDWLRSLVGVTDATTEAPAATPAEAQTGDVAGDVADAARGDAER